ncbi:MAG: cell division protein ZapB [candidate division Zixibacteria bacterium]|nr:cell division protein ZapB [candidate division Zixibacteria bacterium]MCK4605830.1 cell division protein ZapB [candidate division Zixibacteria bacterium]
MSDKFDLVAEKVDRLLDVVEKLKGRNNAFEQENAELKSQLAKIEKAFHALQLETADRAEAVRTKLDRVLGRLAELENLPK